MHESFPSSSGGEQQPQYEAPIENQPEQVEVVGDNIEYSIPSTQALGQEVLETIDSHEEERSFEDSVEKTPVIDTAESLADRQEKLAKGIKIVVGGPPHSGKSVFIEALTQNLDKDNTFSFSAAPDGEGPWLQRHYDNPDVVKLRQKGKFTPEFVADRKKKINDWEGPLMIIDVGGRTSEENAQMIEGATHAIILAGDLSKVAEWRDFFEENNVEVIAKLHSHYQGDHDIQRPMEPEKSHITSSVHHLERGEYAADRETIQQVAGLISGLVDGNNAYKQSHEGENANPFEVFIPETFKDLPSEIIERTITTRDGKQKQVQNKQILRSAIPQIYEKALDFDDQPAWLNGPVNSWEAIALAMAFEDAGSNDVRLRGPDGYIPVEKLPEVEEVDTRWWEAPQQQGEIDGKPIYVIHNTAHASNNPVSPKDLETMTVPKLPENAIVVISTQGPNWLKASIASGYKDKVSGIAAFQPGEGSTIAWAEDRDMLGGIINYKEGIANLEMPAISADQYKKDANRNLMEMSRTAHGTIDVSASNTKAESIEVDENANIADLATSGFDRAIDIAYEAKEHHFESAAELRKFVETIAMTVNGGIVKDGMLIRSGEDSDKYPYTRIADLPATMDNFYGQLLERINDPNADPVETAAFAEYGIDLTGHFFSDGCGKTAKAISSFVLMRQNHKLPDYARGQDRSYKENRAEYYAHAPKQIQGIDQNEDIRAYHDFVDYYRTLF